MNRILILMITLTVAFNIVLPCDTEDDRNSALDFNSIQVDSGRYEFKKDCIYIYKRGNQKKCVKITSESKLYINGKKIEVKTENRSLLAKYYNNLREVRKMAEDLAYEGGKLGLKGGGIAVEAILKLPKLFLEGSEEYEKEVETEVEEIEKEAEKLEKRGEEIEKIADKVEEDKEKLKEKIEELGELKWY